MDYFETYSRVAKHTIVGVVLSLAVSKDWALRQLDVNNAFLHGHLSEEVYMSQPPVFVDEKFPNHICQLDKAIYSFNQAPRACYVERKDYLLSHGFHHSKCDHCLFIYGKSGVIIYLVVYVDDLIITGDQSHYGEEFIKQLGTRFYIKNLGNLNFFLGVEVIRSPLGLFLNQQKYLW